MYIATERNKESGVKYDFYDENCHHLEVQQLQHPNAKVRPQCPKNYSLMVEYAENISKGITHLRVDFYEVGERVYFGEMTSFSMSGVSPYSPSEWDYKIGEWLELPKN